MPRPERLISLAAIGFALIWTLAAPLGADESWTPVRSFRSFTKAVWRGLPQSTVTSMAQDTDGVLWIGTFDGLASFDGQELVPVAPKPNAPVRGVLTAMVAGHDGGLYVTSPAGVHASEKGEWRLLPSKRTPQALAEAKDGTLWMADIGGAVWTLGPNDAWQPHPEIEEEARALAAAPDGSVWAATPTGATRLHGGEATRLGVSDLKGAPNAILVARDGRTWLTTVAGTLHWTSPANPTWHQVALTNWPPAGKISLTQDRRGRIWAGTVGGRVAFGTPEAGWTTWGPSHRPPGGILSILADREGSLWFGMNVFGLAQWVGEPWSHRVSFAEGGSSTDRMSMGGIARGNSEHSLLVSAFGFGTLRLAEGKAPRTWGAPEGLTETARYAVEPEPGNLWVAVRFGVMEAHTGQPFRQTLKLQNGFATGLFRSPEGRWYAATSTAGVYARHGTSWHPVPSINEELDDPHVRGMVWARNGELWVETLRGVSIFRDEKVVQRIGSNSEPSMPPSVNAVVETADGDMWVGGIGGIAVRHGATWRSLNMENGPGPTVYSMARAPDGAIWVGGASGVGRYADGGWTTWDARSGLLEDECNLNGMLIDDDGSVYVGTMGSLARYDPKVEPLPPPPLKLRWIEAPAEGPNGVSTLDRRQLQLRWSAAWLGSRPVQYRTRLPGLRDAWSEPTTNGRLVIENLAPGSWPVEVEARVEGTEPWTGSLRLNAMVTPYWHETLPARTGMAGLLVLFGVGAVRLRMRALRRHASALESTVRARTAELADKVGQLEVSERRAQAASRAKTTFLANMSHELRTPLNGVLGFAQLMARRPARDAEDRKHLDVILRSSEHLLGLINDVLSLARIEAGGPSLNQSTFNPAALVTGVEQLLQPRAEAKGLILRTEIEPDLPLQVVADAGKLRQILLNLVGNAVKFTERGEVTVYVSWTAGRAAFEVRDTGPGIVAEEVGRLFEPFGQTATGRSTHEGTGLGLALSQELARLMGGTISVQSLAAHGSTFRLEVSLPIAEPTSDPEGSAPTRRVTRLVPGQPPWRILVADDVPENRDALCGLLGAVGFEVRTAADGEQAMSLWRQWRPHLIWMDKRMPVIDGLETTRRIRAAPPPEAPSVKIIVLSASALDHERSEIMESGCDDFLSKPFREEAVFTKMAEQLGVRYEYEWSAVSPVASESPASETDRGPDTALLALPVARRLAALVATGDLAALKVYAELQRALGPGFGGPLREIEICLQRMDFESARPLVVDLCASLAQAATPSPPP